MAHPVYEADLGNQSWSASGQISLTLQYRPMTITRMAIVVRTVVSTGGAAGTYNDPFDRIINSLSISQGTDPSQSYINVGAVSGLSGGGLRLLQHGTRYWSPMAAGRRPNAPGNNASSVTLEFAYILHFGVQPMIFDPRSASVIDNPFDLTGGIPVTPDNAPTILGTFDSASVEGTGWTISDGRFSAYLWGVEYEENDDPILWMPRTYPSWTHHMPQITGTSAIFSKTDSPDGGTLLHSITGMTTQGSSGSDNSKPRSDQLLNSLALSSRKQGGYFWRVGGVSISDSYANNVHTLTGISTTVAEQYKPAEILSQLGMGGGWPPSEDAINGTLGNNAVSQVSDAGIFYLPVHKLMNNSDPNNKNGAARSPVLSPWGLDNRLGNTLTVQWGVANYLTPSGGAVPQTLDLLYRAYTLNPNHPLNAGL